MSKILVLGRTMDTVSYTHLDVYKRQQFIQDTGLSQEDLNMNYDDVVEMYKSCLLYTSVSRKDFPLRYMSVRLYTNMPEY